MVVDDGRGMGVADKARGGEKVESQARAKGT